MVGSMGTVINQQVLYGVPGHGQLTNPDDHPGLKGRCRNGGAPLDDAYRATS